MRGERGEPNVRGSFTRSSSLDPYHHCTYAGVVGSTLSLVHEEVTQMPEIVQALKLAFGTMVAVVGLLLVSYRILQLVQARRGGG